MLRRSSEGSSQMSQGSAIKTAKGCTIKHYPHYMYQFVVKIVQIQRSAKLNTMGCTKRTAHCGHISLAEVVVLFSQQIHNNYIRAIGLLIGCPTCSL